MMHLIRTICKNEDKNQYVTNRIITFNLLSHTYCDSTVYPTVRGQYLDDENRQLLLEKLLNNWIKGKYIMCFQEVNSIWDEFIKNHIADKQYNFVSAIYANSSLGVGIAYPMMYYDLLDYDIYCPGDLIKDHYVLFNDLDSKSFDHKIINEFNVAKSMPHKLLTVLLRPKNRPRNRPRNHEIIFENKLIVSTYHMPCEYERTNTMISHIYSIKNRIKILQQQWNKKYLNCLAVILAGDFNIKPRSLEYTFLVNNLHDNQIHDNQKHDNQKIDQIILHAHELYRKIGLNTYDLINLRSAFMEINEREPAYTNVCIRHINQFVNCIDYILINEHIDVMTSNVELTVVDPKIVAYPNRICPSDHLPLSASLRFNAKTNVMRI